MYKAIASNATRSRAAVTTATSVAEIVNRVPLVTVEADAGLGLFIIETTENGTTTTSLKVKYEDAAGAVAVKKVADLA